MLAVERGGATERQTDEEKYGESVGMPKVKGTPAGYRGTHRHVKN